MSYLDIEIIKDLKSTNTNFTTLSDSEYELITNKINETIPFSVCNIAWSLLNDSIYIGATSSYASMTLLADTIKSITASDVIILGDSIDSAYLININNIAQALRIFSTIPQHTYITQQNLKWIAGMSFESDIYFSTLQT
ncbi:hypothetical protein [Edaphovirga cremea]|uniref:hypothetical protein n=1 Tax=Edaphovirga cremea TaxID=2267246 RepID=UPI003989275A